MAKKMLLAIIDMTFPDTMTDDDYIGEDLLPPASALQEVKKILNSGATEEGFDIDILTSSKAASNNVAADMLVDLVQQ